MLFALKNKRKLALLLALLAAVLLFALPAQAEDPFSFSLSVEPASLTAPGPVTVSIRVVNNTGADLTEPVSLQDPDGNVVTAFGDGGQALIKQGEYVTAQHSYDVKQEQLNDGKLTYTLSYNVVDEAGDVVTQTLAKSAEIAYTGSNVDLKVNRTIDPEVVRSGKTVTVQYELYNAGNVEIKNIRIRENSSISGAAQTVASLAAGESKTIQFASTMGGSALTSAGKVTYTAEGETSTITLPEMAIPKAAPGLELNDILSADKTSITDGETVTLTLTIKNNGNITYSNISVTDATYGELFTNLTLAPGDTLIREKQFALSETTTFKYTVTLPDNTGTTNTVTSNEVKVSVYDPSQVLLLTLRAEANVDSIPEKASDVVFTLTLTNNSGFTAKNIAITHGATSIYTVAQLAPAESITFSRNFTVSQGGKFRFTASAKDPLDNTVSFDSNVVHLPIVEEKTATPTPTLIPPPATPVLVTTAPVEVLEPVKVQTNQMLKTAAYVLAGLSCVTILLFLISTIIRVHRHNASKNAYDHMELSSTRDYTERSKNPGSIADNEPEAEDLAEDELPPQDPLFTAAPSERPSDSILREDIPTAAESSENDAGYRLTRDGSTAFADTPAPQQPEAPASADENAKADAPAETAETPAPEAAPAVPQQTAPDGFVSVEDLPSAESRPSTQRHRRNRRADKPSEDE